MQPKQAKLPNRTCHQRLSSVSGGPRHLPTKTAHVIGLGKSGVAAARLLHRHGWQVTLSDRTPGKDLLIQAQALKAEGITVLLGHSFVPSPDLDRLVLSPGVPWDIPAVVTAREMDIDTIGEMELAWQHLQTYPWVGVTGTNGKTTTTALIAAMFQAAGYHAPACGNIGYAACEVALAAKPPDWVIAELSSYQIEAAPTLAPTIGLWTTFTADHLNRHKTLENYYNIKASLLQRSQHQVLNGDDAYLAQQRQHWPNACWTQVSAPEPPVVATLQDDWACYQGQRIVPIHSLLMAVTAARLAGIEADAIAQAVAEFPGVAHRLERIGTWQGVSFINDSKATNYDAAEVGLRSVMTPTILIAGGEAKDGDDLPWLQRIQERAAAVLLIGAAAPAFAARLAAVGYQSYEIVETMEAAVTRGAALAPQLGASTVLLSPACASFDQYPNFEKRGDHFRQICLEQFG
jgi:UDP-N-acetylmuramoylalanine--D-glutamate ligase